MKKLTILISVILLMTMLASCINSPVSNEGNSGVDTSQSDTNINAETEPFNKDYGSNGMLPITNEPVTLKALAMEVTGTTESTKYVNTEEYEKMTGVKIEWDYISQGEDFNTVFNLLVASKEYPDIIFRGLDPHHVSMAIEGKVFIPLNDLIDEYGYYYKKVLAEHPDYVKHLSAPDGKIYNFPYTDTGVHKNTEYKMWVYSEWLSKLEINMPVNTDEFKEMLIAFRDKDPNGNNKKDEIPLVGFYGGRKTDPICFLMNSFQLYEEKYYYLSDDGKIQFIANTDGWRDGLRYLNDLYKNGLILEETYVQDQTQFRSLLNRPAGETIVGTYPSWYQGAFIDRNVLNWTDYEPIPPLEGPSGLRQVSARKGAELKLTCAISTQCKNPEVAFMWYDWLLSDEGCVFGHYGVEGITYEWVDQPAYNGASRSISVTRTGDQKLWGSGPYPRNDQEKIRYITTVDEAKKNTDNTFVLLTAAKLYEPFYVWNNIPKIIWSSDTDLVAEKAEYETLFQDYIGSRSTAFILGNLDINNDSDWQNYVNTLEKMGLNKYMDCLAKYFDQKE